MHTYVTKTGNVNSLKRQMIADSLNGVKSRYK